MKQKSVWQSIVWVLLAGVLLAGCGGGPKKIAPPTKDLLLKAGFLAEPVKDPAHLERLPIYQFAVIKWEGKTIYVYTEPRGGNLYFGSVNDYYRYKAQASITEAREALEAPPSARPTMSAADWGMYESLHKVEP